MATSTKKGTSTSRSTKTATKAVKKLSKKVGNGGVIALAIFLVLGLAIGFGVGMFLTGNDEFTLVGEVRQDFLTTDVVNYSDCILSFTCVDFGKDASDDVVISTELEKDSDGKLVMNEGSYITTYTYQNKFGKTINRYSVVTISEP